MAKPIRTVSLTIPINTALSDAIKSDGYYPVGVVCPSAWTAADISFEISSDGGVTFQKVVGQTGSLVKITNVPTAASEYSTLASAQIIVGEWIRVASTNTASEADANQAAARTVKLVMVPF